MTFDIPQSYIDDLPKVIREAQVDVPYIVGHADSVRRARKRVLPDIMAKRGWPQSVINHVIMHHSEEISRGVIPEELKGN